MKFTQDFDHKKKVEEFNTELKMSGLFCQIGSCMTASIESPDLKHLIAIFQLNEQLTEDYLSYNISAVFGATNNEYVTTLKYQYINDKDETKAIILVTFNIDSVVQIDSNTLSVKFVERKSIN